MNQNYFAHRHGLEIGDRLVRAKGVITAHHGIFIGHNGFGIPLVAENQRGYGVQIVSLETFMKHDESLLWRIERFPGSAAERRQVVPRIKALLGKEYDLINFNCEHLAELVQYGKSKSNQVTNGFLAAIVGAFIVGAIVSND
jgi:Lecithin retinol acyltransferase